MYGIRELGRTPKRRATQSRRAFYKYAKRQTEFASPNIVTLTGKSRDVVVLMKTESIDLMCLQGLHPISPNVRKFEGS